MSATPLLVTTRPFAIEPITGIMLSDGIFDNALHELLISCHVTNTSGSDQTGVSVYLESVSDPGIVVTGKTFHLPVVKAGASVLLSWFADFEAAVPGKPLVSFVATATGHEQTRSIRQIFVSETRYDDVTDVYVCRVPEGELHISRLAAIPPGPGGWLPMPPPPPPHDDPDWEPKPWPGPHVPDGITMSWYPAPAYPGTHGPLPFDDPWWKILALIVALIALIVGIIAAVITKKPFNIGIKGKFDVSDQGLETKCCTPAPKGGVKAAASVAGVCGAIASAGLATALSDAADPFRRGQAATPPGGGELTTVEHVTASWTYLDPPLAGTPYRTGVRWNYRRVTTVRSYSYSVSETQQHIHVTKNVTVTTSGGGATGFVRAEAVFTKPDNSIYRGP